MVKTKSVFSPVEPAKAGLRILANRFRGRGMGTTHYNVSILGIMLIVWWYCLNCKSRSEFDAI